jgi:hypothetical protein
VTIGCELIAAALLLIPLSARLGSVLSGLLLVSFSIAIWRTPSLNAGCGCWRSTNHGDQGRVLLLARNGLLLLLVLVGSISVAPMPLGVWAFALVAGGMLSLLLLELPQLGIVARAQTQGG